MRASTGRYCAELSGLCARTAGPWPAVGVRVPEADGRGVGRADARVDGWPSSAGSWPSAPRATSSARTSAAGSAADSCCLATGSE